jgi:hypothetical protein
MAKKPLNPKWHRYALRVACEVGLDLAGFLTPASTFPSVVSYEFLLFCVNADYRKTFIKELRL